MPHSPDDLQLAYEEIPYPGVADPEAHIRCLEAMAALHGLQPADIHACRVLELGCASGRNLLAQVADYPGSRFVGIDFSADQIAEGRAVIAALGLRNVELRHARIEDVGLDRTLGSFASRSALWWSEVRLAAKGPRSGGDAQSWAKPACANRGGGRFRPRPGVARDDQAAEAANSGERAGKALSWANLRFC